MAWTDFLLPDLAWQSLTPELVILLFAILAPIVALWDTDRRGMQQFGLIGVGGAFLLTLGSLFGWRVQDLFGSSIDFTLQYIGSDLKGAYAITEASQLFKLLFLGVAFVALLGMGRPLAGKAEDDHGEFVGLILFATLGMMVVASATELVTLFLGIETASLSSYLLAGFRRDRLGAEAGLKYFVIGAISSGMGLFAISLLYGVAGTTSIPGIAEALSLGSANEALAGVAFVLLLVAFGFKISSVPFHAWAPDVYSGSPVPVAGMLASASKAMGFVALFQVFLVGLLPIKADWELVVALLAVASMFVGNLIALQQTSVRRMLAYSSIAQAGYLLIALAVGTTYAVGGGILHLIVNAAMKLGAFLIVGGLLYVGIQDHLDGWKGLAKRAPLLGFAMAVFLLSMAGIPPLGGFTSKFVLFSGAVQAGIAGRAPWLLLLAAVAILNSAISLYYYLRFIRAIYVEPGEETHRVALPRGVSLAVVLCLVTVVAIGVWPQLFLEGSLQAATAFLPGSNP